MKSFAAHTQPRCLVAYRFVTQHFGCVITAEAQSLAVHFTMRKADNYLQPFFEIGFHGMAGSTSEMCITCKAPELEKP
jgi:hypothetical protein